MDHNNHSTNISPIGVAHETSNRNLAKTKTSIKKTGNSLYSVRSNIKKYNEECDDFADYCDDFADYCDNCNSMSVYCRCDDIEEKAGFTRDYRTDRKETTGKFVCKRCYNLPLKCDCP